MDCRSKAWCANCVDGTRFAPPDCISWVRRPSCRRPDAAINVLLATAILGFPLALVFGWFYDITWEGIVRTPAAGADDAHNPLPLQRKDVVLLGALALIGAFIVYGGVQDIMHAPRV